MKNISIKYDLRFRELDCYNSEFPNHNAKPSKYAIRNPPKGYAHHLLVHLRLRLGKTPTSKPKTASLQYAHRLKPRTRRSQSSAVGHHANNTAETALVEDVAVPSEKGLASLVVRVILHPLVDVLHQQVHLVARQLLHYLLHVRLLYTQQHPHYCRRRAVFHCLQIGSVEKMD